MPRSIWNGVISFGMVSIPVKLYSATESKDVSFHMLHAKCKTRIREQKFCPHCERKVEWEEIEKGYEYARGHYVMITKEDLEALPLPSKHTIDVSAFVKIEEIDPIYFEKTYYLEPDQAALRPFKLFMKALQDKEMVGLGTIAIRNKERLCALRPMEGTLVMETLLYPDEIRVARGAALPDVRISEKEQQMAAHLVDLMAQEFDPEKYKDHYRQALKTLIEAKLEGEEIVESSQVPATSGKLIDLMEALRASVESVRGKGKTRGAKSAAEKEKATAKSGARASKTDVSAARIPAARKSKAASQKRSTTSKKRKKSA